MPRWIKLVTLLAAALLLVLGFVLPWFRAAGDGETLRVLLEPLAMRGDSGLRAEACTAQGCISFPTGRLPGGLAWLAILFVHASIVMLAITAYQVARDRPVAQLAVWSAGASAAVFVLAAIVGLSFDGPADVAVHVGGGLWATLAGAVLAIVGQSRVFDALDPEPVAIAAVASSEGAHAVRAGEFAFAGLRLTTAAGIVRIGWDELARCVLIRSPALALELTVRGGDVLRITAASRMDYRFLPGGPGATDDENLQRLHAFAHERHPFLG